MADVFTTAERRRIMQAIGARNTEPERLVRRLADALGLRYRLHDDRLPGSPDLVFPRLKKVVFVHGCFWHRHTCRKGRSTPTKRAEFWRKKFADNVRRDRRVRRLLRRDGWGVLTVWECRLTRQHLPRTAARLAAFLTENRRTTDKKPR